MSASRYGIMARNTLFTLVIVTAFFEGLELVLAMAGVRPVILDEDPLIGFAETIPLFVEAERSDGTAILRTAPNHLRLFNYQEFPRDKAAASFRIFCMGGSTTHGRPYNDPVSFCGWLRAYLQAADPAHDWEVINAGGISYASYRVARLMNELSDYEPDLFIVYTGQNEFLEERSYRGLINLPDWLINLHGTVSATRTYAAMQRVVEFMQPEAPSNAARGSTLSGDVDDILSRSVGPKSYHRDDALKRQIITHFRLNVMRMVRIARDAGADVVFVQPAINVKDMSPFKSEHGEGLDEKGLARWESFYARARALQEDGHHDAALELYRQARDIDDRHADLHYRIGQSLFALRRYGDADNAFRRAVEEDIVPLRILASMQDIITQVAETGDVPLVDFPAILRAAYFDRYDHAVFGKEYFRDHVHTDMEGYRLLGFALFRQLVAAGIAVPDDSWNALRREAVEREVVANLDPRIEGHVAVNLGRVLEWSGKFDEAYRAFRRAREILGPSPMIYDRLGRASFILEKYDDTIRYMREALELYPQMTEVRANLALALARQGKNDEAIEQYRAEIELDPTSSYAHAGLADLFEQQGDDDAALEHYRLALQFRPDNEYVLVKMAYLLIRQQRLDEALGYARTVLRVNPKQYRAHNAVALIMGRQGNTGEAIRHYSKALRLEPGNHVAKEGLLRATSRSEKPDIVTGLVESARQDTD